MIGIYFSGTGNTKYCVSKFLEYYHDNNENNLYSIEDKNCINMIKENNDIVFAYPIYHSDMPIIVRNFINNNKGDDDIYYRYAYLKLNNAKQLIFDFNSMTLYVTSEEKLYMEDFLAVIPKFLMVM